MRQPRWVAQAGSASVWNAPWLHPPAPALSRSAAAGAVVGVYLAGWGPALLAVAWYAASGTVPPGAGWRRASMNIATDVGQAVLLVAVAALAARLLSRSWGMRIPSRIEDGYDECAAGGLYLLVVMISLGPLMSSIAWATGTSGTYPPTPSPTAGSALQDLVSAVLAGPTEEMFFCVFLGVVLRAAGARMRTVLAVSALLRLAFHAYYGPAVVGLSVWGVGVVLLYVVTGRVVGLIVAHSAWDVAGVAQVHHWLIVQLVAVGVIGALVIAVVTQGTVSLWRHRHPPGLVDE